MRPSLMASTIEAKSSLSKIMSEAFLATSVPILPIAMPMSALLRAGASLTPSPVMAITKPLFLSAVAMRNFCSGAMRANANSLLLILAINSSSDKVSSVLPLITSLELELSKPTFLAIALAVIS